MFKNMKLGTKLLVAFLAVGVIPFAVVGVVSMLKASTALESQAYNQLVAMREVKKAQVNDYFNNAFLQMGVFSHSKDVKELYDALVSYHKATNVQANGSYDPTTSEYKQVYEEYGQNIVQFQHDSGLYDVFVICAAHGHVMFTAAKEFKGRMEAIIEEVGNE